MSSSDLNYLVLTTLVIAAFVTVMLIATQQAYAQAIAHPNAHPNAQPTNQSLGAAIKILLDSQKKAYNAGRAAGDSGQPDTCPPEFEEETLCTAFNSGWIAVTH